jgi:hypothetical protein
MLKEFEDIVQGKMQNVHFQKAKSKVSLFFIKFNQIRFTVGSDSVVLSRPSAISGIMHKQPTGSRCRSAICSVAEDRPAVPMPQCLHNRCEKLFLVIPHGRRHPSCDDGIVRGASRRPKPMPDNDPQAGPAL